VRAKGLFALRTAAIMPMPVCGSIGGSVRGGVLHPAVIKSN
jgi:hypothetical protein